MPGGVIGLMVDEMDEIDLLAVWKIPKDVSEEAMMEPEI